MCKPHEQLTINLRALRRGRAQVLDPPLKLRNALQGAVPACLQFTCDMSLGGIDQLIASRCQRDFVVRRLQITFNSTNHLVAGRCLLTRGDDGGLNRMIRDCLKALQRNCPIDTHTADANAKPGADMTIIAAALVAVRITFAHAVKHTHHPPAAAAPHQTTEERAPPAP